MSASSSVSAGAGAARASAMFDTLDRNHDGVISREEFATAGQVVQRQVRHSVSAATPAAYTVGSAPRVVRVVGPAVYAGTTVLSNPTAQRTSVHYGGTTMAGTPGVSATPVLSGSLSGMPVVSGGMTRYSPAPVSMCGGTYTAEPVFVGSITVDGGVYNPQVHGAMYGQQHVYGQQVVQPMQQLHPVPTAVGQGMGPLAPGMRPPQPQRYTDNMPHPEAIEHQKQVYSRSLDVQLQQGEQMLYTQSEVQKRALRQAAEQQKQQFDLQVVQELKVQEMSVDQQANYQLMGLQQAHHEQFALLEQQANTAILEFEQKKVQDEFARQQYEYQMKAFQKQNEMHLELEKQRQAFAAKQRALQEAYAMQGVQLQREAQSAAASAAMQVGAGYGGGGYGAAGYGAPCGMAGSHTAGLGGTYGHGLVGWS